MNWRIKYRGSEFDIISYDKKETKAKQIEMKESSAFTDHDNAGSLFIAL